MPTNTTVIDIRSLSYTGTTWLNLVLGTSSDAFAIGPPDRLFRLLEPCNKEEGAPCRVCGDPCSLWDSILPRIDPEKNVYRQVSELTGCSHLVINNPAPGRAQDDLDETINIKPVFVVRDGRGTIHSYRRYFPDKSMEEAINWFLPAARSLHAKAESSGSPTLRFEDLIVNPEEALLEAASYSGLELPHNAHLYWEHDLHPVAGNAGAIAMRKLHLGLQVSGKRTDFITRYDRLVESKGRQALEEGWKETWTPDELHAFDRKAGAFNAGFNYDRDPGIPGNRPGILNRLHGACTALLNRNERN